MKCPQCGKPIEGEGHRQRISRRSFKPKDLRGGTFKRFGPGRWGIQRDTGIWTYTETLCSPQCGAHHQMSMEG